MLIKNRQINSKIKSLLVIGLVFANIQAFARDCEKRSDGLYDNYGLAQNEEFYDSINEDKCHSKEEKKYEEAVDAAWPKMSNLTYFKLGFGYPEYQLSIDESTIKLNKFKVEDKTAFEQKPYVLNFHGSLGYKWENFALEIFANYVGEREIYSRISYKELVGVTEETHNYFTYGKIKSFALMINPKYHFLNHKRFSVYGGLGFGLKKDFGSVQIYEGKDGTGISEIPGTEDFRLAATRSQYAEHLKVNYDLASADLFGTLFNSISDFTKALTWNIELGVQYYVIDDLMLDVSIKSMDYRFVDIPMDSTNKRLYSLNGPRTFGLHFGVTYSL